jgi:hypothetical protein
VVLTVLMTNDSLLLDLDCPCLDFGGNQPSTSQQLLALMPWLGVVSPKHGDIAAVVQMAVDNELTAQEIAETLNSSLATAYRLSARNKAWLQAARQLELIVHESRAGGLDIFAQPLGTILLTPRVRDTLARGSVSKKQQLTVGRLRDHWSFEHLQRIPCFDLVGMDILAKSLVLVGLGDDFEDLIRKILRATRKRRDTELVECLLPEAPVAAPGHRAAKPAGGFKLEFMDRAAAVQREFAWGAPATLGPRAFALA